MPTADQARLEVQRKLAAARRRRDAAKDECALLVGTAQRQHRAVMTPAEVADFNRARAARRELNDEIRSLVSELQEIEQMRTEDHDYMRRASETRPVQFRTPREPYDQAARIGYEARTYNPDTDPTGNNFILDVARNFVNRDPGAGDRLARHIAEERVERPGYQQRAAGDANTGAFAGLTVPQYLTDLYAPQISNLRPFADVCCRKVNLPPNGMALDISKITTGTSTALQANELDTASATSIDDTLLTVPVQTAAGQQRVSLQAIQRGTGVEDVITQDLMRKHAVTIDSTIITQASTGLTNISQAITYTSASPTGPEFYPFMYQAASKLEQALEGVAFPTHVVMHSRRWNWLASQVSSSWPIVNSAGVPAQSAAFSLTTEYGPQIRAILASGLRVVVDNNIPTNLGVGTNQDEVYVVSADESMYLAEDVNAPLLIRAEQPAAPNLGVLLVVYSFFAYFSRYANPSSKISGTGLVGAAGF